VSRVILSSEWHAVNYFVMAGLVPAIHVF
jgi:hypothetical protein